MCVAINLSQNRGLPYRITVLLTTRHE